MYPTKIVCSVTHLPFKDEVFVFVWACVVIEHVKQDCIEEIIRVAKHAVIVTPNRHSPVDFFKRLLGRETWWSPGHVRLYGVGELKKLGRVYGDTPGVPKRSFWVKFLPNRFWLLFPRLSHVLILDVRR